MDSRVEKVTEYQKLQGSISFTANWINQLFSPFLKSCDRRLAPLAERGKLSTLFIENQTIFLGLLIVGLYIITPRYLLIFEYAFQKFILLNSSAALDTTIIPYFPNLPAIVLIVFFVLNLFNIYLSVSLSLSILIGLSIVVDGSFDLISIVFYLLFISIIYGVIKVNLNRKIRLIIVCGLSIGFLIACHEIAILNQFSIRKIAAFQAALLPMLWYSVYEELPPKKTLNLGKMISYLSARIIGSPVFTYKEFFSKPDRDRLKVHFSGVKVLYIASLVSTLSWILTQIDGSVDGSKLTGSPLLLYSYMLYVKRYCRIWIYMNVFIGVARLFGIPIRDNFNYWLLARTPNEHWRRWNILMREWVVTFVFFPIMRSKKWLFVSVMAALIVSGILHQLFNIIVIRPGFYKIGSAMIYWVINGLAIYAVIKFPIKFPGIIKFLRIKESKTWSLIGIVLTSAFYAVIHHGTTMDRFDEVIDYIGRLCSV